MKGSIASLGAVLGGGKRRSKLTQEQHDAVALWGSGPWEFLSGKWPLPRHAGAKGSAEPRAVCWTNDTYNNAVRPFPDHAALDGDYEYLRYEVIEPAFMGGIGKQPM